MMDRGAGRVRGWLQIGALTGVLVVIAAAARAEVEIIVDKTQQRLDVVVDGERRYRWPVSSGLPAYETPDGTFKAFRMEADHFSREWDDAPMPHSIFFTTSGHAIHGTDAVQRLGAPASHGCIRLSRDNARILFELVTEQGLGNTSVRLSGSAKAALAAKREDRESPPARQRTDTAATTGAGEQRASRHALRRSKPAVAVRHYASVTPGSGDPRQYQLGRYYFAVNTP